MMAGVTISLGRVALVWATVFLMGALCVSGSGCTAGQTAREEVLAPAIAIASPGLREDVEAGIAALPASERPSAQAVSFRFFAAAATADRAAIRDDAWPLWPRVRSLAQAGIQRKLDDGVIGPVGAESLRERVRNYGEALSRVVEGMDP